MDPVIASALTALAGVALRGITLLELLMRLRWQERQQRAHYAYLTALARVLPGDRRMEEIRADGRELHLVLTGVAEVSGRPSR